MGPFQSQALPVTYSVVTEFQGLEPNMRENIAGYMGEFYAVIVDPEAVKREIVGHCL